MLKASYVQGIQLLSVWSETEVSALNRNNTAKFNFLARFNAEI